MVRSLSCVMGSMFLLANCQFASSAYCCLSMIIISDPLSVDFVIVWMFCQLVHGPVLLPGQVVWDIHWGSAGAQDLIVQFNERLYFPVQLGSFGLDGCINVNGNRLIRAAERV